MSSFHVFKATGEIVRVNIGYDYIFIVNLAGQLRAKIINDWELVKPLLRELNDIEKIIMNAN